MIELPRLLANAAATDTFSSGALTGDAQSYVLNVMASSQASVVVDNLTLMRVGAAQTAGSPPSWTRLAGTPFPRLGNYQLDSTDRLARGGGVEGPLTYSVDQIERRLAFSDVVAGLSLWAQTQSPDSLHRLRQLNPNIVLLPYRISQEQETNLVPPSDASIDLNYRFQVGLPDQWFVRDSQGNPVPDPDWPFIRKMNISPYCSVIDGQTFNSYLLNWLDGTVFASGMWDGVFFDNLFGRVNPHILNYSNPALLDYDWNLNHLRDETPAMSSEMTREAGLRMLQDLRSRVGDLQLVIGNTGSLPELHFAPYVNGYVFEGFNFNWDAPWLPLKSAAGWRLAFDTYQAMQAAVKSPKVNILEGSGDTGYGINPDRSYLYPTARDIQIHRFTLGTVLLDDGFYEYDLLSNVSAPYWFDEYSVTGSGVANEDPSHKGYLGQALGNAVELAGQGTLLLHEDFDDGTLPATVAACCGALTEVISGNGSLVLSSPNYTNPAYASTRPEQFAFAANNTYRVEFDWRIIETLDGNAVSDVFAPSATGGTKAEYYPIPGVVSGDSGTARFPVTIPAIGDWSLRFGMANGGGKIAIDNLRVSRGGVGPWRRDFENGFVLVNPLAVPYTFTANELAGPLNRTNIRRIRGTQAPDVNNGQLVTDTLTLQPFDAIVLLAAYPAGINGSAYSRNYVQKAYVAYYGRPADPGGLTYWAKRMDAEGQSLNAIIGAFGYSDEFNRRYGGLSNTALVTKIYQQALNRDPDPAGLNWYVGELQAGRRTLQTITLDVLNGATTAPDSTIVANKLDVAAYYTDKVATGCPYGTEQDGVSMIAGVSAAAATVTAAKAAIDGRCGS
jgi:hypothetical protein